jgi:alpha-glucoside transport system substrate-binding protein
MRGHFRFLVILCAASLVVAACSSDNVETADAAPALEVFSNYRGAEAEAFRAVLAQFTQQTGIETSYVGTAAFADRIYDRMREGDPPDVALFPQPAIIEELARAGLLIPFDAELTEVVDSAYPRWAVDLGEIDGELYGAWYRLSVKSLVWYPPRAFAASGYDVPETWEELGALTDEMVRDGFTPWCLGMESFGATGWVGTDWIEDIVLRLHGADVYDEWVAGDIPFTDDRIRTAFEEFEGMVLEPGRVVGGARAILSVPVLDAIQPMLADPPGCLLSRQASFQEATLPEGTEVGPSGDVDVFPLPSLDGGRAPLLASGEIAAMLTDSDDGRSLISFLANPDAGVPWAEVGGYSSPHLAFDVAAYASPLEQRLGELVATSEVVRFDGSDLMPPTVGTGTFWQGMVDLVAGVPLESVLAEIQAGYGEASD